MCSAAINRAGVHISFSFQLLWVRTPSSASGLSQKQQPPSEEDRVEGSASAGSGGLPEEKRQRVPALRGIFMDVLRSDALKRLLSALEPLVRRVVKEEVELALANHLDSMSRECGKQISPAFSRNLQLQFLNKLSLPIFTGTKIDGEDSSSITIALVDTMNGERVTSGPESSMKVEIVVLEGDFEGNEQGNWTVEEFKNNVVKERDGKRSLLTGDIFFDLNEGIGAAGELSFTDNSSWTRSRKFRLGARIVDSQLNGIRVREARTEAFTVKDHRGELYKKHYPPLLFDEVWRLEKIGKDGAFHKRLSSENIHTVKDFLTLLVTDLSRLRNILGNGMSARMWESTVDHARTCPLTNQMHLYYADDLQKTGIVFNVIGEVMGILMDQQFVHVNDLSDAQKADAKMLAKQVIQNGDIVLPFDIGAATAISSPPLQISFPPPSQPFRLPDDTCSDYSSPLKVDGNFNFGYSAISSPDIFSRSFDSFSHQSAELLGSRYEPESADLDKISNPHVLFDESRSHEFFGENLQYYDPDISFLSKTLGIESQSDLGSAVASFITRTQWRPYAVWGILLLVVKWKFSIKKKVATKKKQRFGQRVYLVEENMK
ncbi:calmodulin-binding protein 60 A [Phalaenopsis equestris]|uniref:calmodulin-binding protein 60 A n=1 Tax=Phalaenopsis equestris TaxID=78828 RepID=UPI0009E1ACAD|nr:calmodulin-binding protein 60 A [Phalaenopsis equestris]